MHGQHANLMALPWCGVVRNKGGYSTILHIFQSCTTFAQVVYLTFLLTVCYFNTFFLIPVVFFSYHIFLSAKLVFLIHPPIFCGAVIILS